MIRVSLRVEVKKPRWGKFKLLQPVTGTEMKIKSGFALAYKSVDIVDILHICARRFRKCMGLLC